MRKRLHMTNADYMAIAVSPALIMLLVGSIVFFLIEISYVGQYALRLNYVFALFVFATVLIGRISIEFGPQKAAIYSVPLGILTFIFLQKFVEHPSSFSPWINLGLIVVVWWCAHKLTWDCTLIDDNEDSSGEGLIQKIGIDTPSDADSSQPESTQELDRERPALWKRFFLSQSGPHAPGLWVLYFSLAALPIFGLGQRLIESTNTAARRYAFLLLVIYMAAALSLLVTTSFLGLRRYLRQRQLEMPTIMASTWLGVGCALTIIVIIFAMFVPRPSTEYTISEPLWRIGSPSDLQASKQGFGNDGAKGDESAQAVESEDENAPAGNKTTSEKREQSASSDIEKAKESSGSKSQQSKSSGKSSQSNEQQKTDGNKSANQMPSGNSQDGKEAKGEEISAKGGDQSEKQPRTNPGDQKTQPSTPNESRQESDRLNSSDSTPPNASQSVPSNPLTADGLLYFIKVAFYIAMIVAGCYFAYRYRYELLTAVKEMIREIRAWLASLFTGTKLASENINPEPGFKQPVVRKRFRDFQNPFRNGKVSRMNPVEIVRYTYDAFEAWSSDRGRPRSSDQTPQEFARWATPSQDAIHRHTIQLVLLYSQIAYGNGSIEPEEVTQLQGVWREMEAAASTPLAKLQASKQTD